MVRERQAPRVPGRSTQAPVVISDDEGEPVYEISSSPMPNHDQMPRLSTSQSRLGKSRLQDEVDLVSSSVSDLEGSTFLSSKEKETSRHTEGTKSQVTKIDARKEDVSKQTEDDSLDKFMEALKLGTDRFSDGQQRQQQSQSHGPHAPVPQTPIFQQANNTNLLNKQQLETQPRKSLYSGFSGYTSATNPFNIPKKNKPRPEHHKPDPLTQDRPQFGQVSALHSPIVARQYNPSHPKQSAHGPPQTPGPPSRRPGDEVVSILRPTNRTFSTPAAPRVLFSSKPTIKKPVSNIDTFTRLTNSKYEKPVTYKSDELESEEDNYDDPIGTTDAYTYVEPEKATENLKALLEGALEDEEDKKPRTRLQKKKTDETVDDLAKQLETVRVEEKKETRQETKQDSQDNEEKDNEEEGEEDDGTVEGMNIKLLPHQIDGVAWMRDKESGRKKTRGVHPKGGILADDMGLGKTVQSIALILTNPRPPVNRDASKEEKKKAQGLRSDVGKGTLIIAPLALIRQWEGEIASRIEYSHRLLTCVYHGPQKNRFSSELHKYDVVITTYGTLSAEHAVWEKKSIEAGLFSNVWYRIILDEAHTIKNRNAKATQAACALAAEYRWCLTGTPMQNNLDELQSLIHFLRIKPYENLATFKDQITKPLNNGRGGLAIRRLQVVLKAFMKRRTKDVLKESGGLHGGKSDRKDEGTNEEKKSSGGFKIVKREVVNIAAEFTPVERRFYDRLQDRTDKTLEKMIDSKLNYASALVLLLRLRQACNHPDLVSGEILKDKDGLFGNISGSSSQKSDPAVDDVANLMGTLTVGSKLCDICQKELTHKEAADRGRCFGCQRALGDLEPAHDKKKRKKKKKVETKDGECEASQPRNSRSRYVVLDSDDDDDEYGNKVKEVSDDQYTWVTDSETDEELAYDAIDETASTKMQNLMKILRKEAPDFKVIVFSFFTSMLDKIVPFLKAAKIGYARYDGGMRNDLREASLNSLRYSDSCRVLLCSLRAGSLGLNLTAASRVVILEPFWNPFVEEQAIDRVHRLNQTVDVKIYKLTIKDTVEERILELQNKKRELANATIEGKLSAGKLTMNDILALFGRDAETRYGEDNPGREFGQKVEVLHKGDEPGSYNGNPKGRGSLGYDRRTQPARRSGGTMESEKRNRRSAQESSVFGRRWN
ncbi:hypothetical protein KEM54_001172 [Ascosphaera aggregata]|nr:hypothetical protein KEM54_001172 [Ascosphaera aggregata]